MPLFNEIESVCIYVLPRASKETGSGGGGHIHCVCTKVCVGERVDAPMQKSESARRRIINRYRRRGRELLLFRGYVCMCVCVCVCVSCIERREEG